MYKVEAASYPTTYPKSQLPEESKNKGWYLAYAKAIYGRYFNGSYGVTKAEHEQMRINRLYAEGRQPIDKYKDRLLGKVKNGAIRKSYMNVDFESVLSVAPKFVRIVQGIFSSQDHKIELNAVNEMANDERESIKWRTYVENKEAAFIKAVDATTGVQSPEPKIKVASIDELNLFSEMGVFKVEFETAMEPAIDFIEHASKWPEIKDKLVASAMTTGKMITKDSTDPETQKISARYVDPENCVYSLDSEGFVSKFMEACSYTVTQLMSEYDIKEEDIEALVQKFSSYMENNTIIKNSLNSNKDMQDAYGDCIIPVYTFEFSDIVYNYKTERENRFGEKKRYDEEFGKIYNDNKRKTEVVKIKVFRRAKWIPGTDHIFNFGLQYDIPRPEYEAKSSYHVEEIPGVPMIQQCIPNFDNIQIAHLKLQHAINKANPSGFAYEYSSLQGMTIAGKKMEPLDIIRMHQQGGSFVFKLTALRGGANTTNPNPFHELKGGIGPLLEELVTLIEVNLNQIRDTTGINQIMDASAPEPKQGLGLSELAATATSNSLKPIYSKYLSIYRGTFENCVSRVLLSAKFNEGAVWIYDNVIGKVSKAIIASVADYGYSGLGIKVQAMPTAKEQAEIEAELQRAMAVGRNGRPLLSMADVFMVRRIMTSRGSLKLAQLFLAYREKERDMEDKQAADENAKSNAKIQEDGIALKAQMEKEQIVFETNEKIRLERELSAIRIREAAELAKYDTQKQASVA